MFVVELFGVAFDVAVAKFELAAGFNGIVASLELALDLALGSLFACVSEGGGAFKAAGGSTMVLTLAGAV